MATGHGDELVVEMEMIGELLVEQTLPRQPRFSELAPRRLLVLERLLRQLALARKQLALGLLQQLLALGQLPQQLVLVLARPPQLALALAQRLALRRLALALVQLCNLSILECRGYKGDELK